MNFSKNCKTMFGDYVESNDGPTVTYFMKPRTHAWIALTPNWNIQGAHKLFDIYIGELFKRRRIIHTPIPN